MHIYSKHQKEQVEVIDKIEERIEGKTVDFSTVSTVNNYPDDKRLCLTSVHMPNNELLESVEKQIINPLKTAFPNHFYYPTSSLHTTIKNVRVISDPPNYTNSEIETVKKVFSSTVPNNKKFRVYFYRLLLFSGNLALLGTTEERLDDLILDLDHRLDQVGMADDKKYLNEKYFFCNMTLARFYDPVSREFVKMVKKLSDSIKFEPYTVDSVTLLTCNAVLEQRQDLGKWNLK